MEMSVFNGFLMRHFLSQKGVVQIALIVIVVIFLLGGFYIGQNFIIAPQAPAPQDENNFEKERSSEVFAVEPPAEPESEEKAVIVEPPPQQAPPPFQPQYSGTVLAGTASPLLDFTKADYDKARASGKIIVLYFYANWCPICLEEEPQLRGAFNALSTDRVAGLRVNFNDSETDNDERSLAQQFGVAYQHTKIFLRGGEPPSVVARAIESWNKDRYLLEINGILAQ